MEPNWTQIDTKLGTNLELNWDQTTKLGTKLKTKMEQNWTQIDTKLGTNMELTWDQTGSKLGPKSPP